MEQNNTDNFTDIWEIIDYYRVRKAGKSVINHTVEDRVFKRLANIPREKRERLIDWLLENRKKNFGLDLMAIEDAVLHDRGYDTPYIVAQDVICECCGTKYQYKVTATSEDHLHRNIFKKCPRCGYCAEDTFHAQSYFVKYGKKNKEYEDALIKHRKKWISGGRKWWYNREDALLIERIQTSGTDDERKILDEIMVQRLEEFKQGLLKIGIRTDQPAGVRA
ncbi:hypothetical protein AGMMS50268_21320 [Spirochaetia bacterium]|nr:hypothetical protein AGMMS50268_21320 [Spirochaetia bacterium]